MLERSPDLQTIADHQRPLQTIRWSDHQTIGDHEVNKWLKQLTSRTSYQVGLRRINRSKTQEQSDNALELKQRVVVKNKTKCDKKAKRGKCKDCDLICWRKYNFQEGQDEDVDGNGLVDVDDEVGHRVALLHLQLALWPAVWRPILRSPWRGANHAIFLMPTRRSFLCWKSSLIMDMWSIFMTFMDMQRNKHKMKTTVTKKSENNEDYHSSVNIRWGVETDMNRNATPSLDKLYFAGTDILMYFVGLI